MSEKFAEKIIIALDGLSAEESLDLVKLARPYASTFKVGLSLFCAQGPDIVKKINDLGAKVFLDLKLHDIPMQVENAVKNLLHLKPHYLTLHAQGGRDMLEAAASAVSGTQTNLLAVSVLTSLSEYDWAELGHSKKIPESVLHLLDGALRSGVKHFVCSPKEVKMLRENLLGEYFLITPGVRPKGFSTQDQSRVMTPGQAIAEGANALVIGRPVTRAENKVSVLKAIHKDIENIFSNSECDNNHKVKI